MLEIILIFGSGIVLGSLLRKKKRIIRGSEIMSSWLIYLLLLVMGISIGSNVFLIEKFAEIGIHSVLITLAGLLGSLLIALLSLKLFFK
ncbi:LysO family transporter [Bacteroidota bacterium]